MSSFITILIIVAIIFYRAAKKSQAQKKKFAQQQKQNTSYTQKTSNKRTERPKEDILTRSKRNVAKDFHNMQDSTRVQQTTEAPLKKQTQENKPIPAATPVSTAETTTSDNIPTESSMASSIPSDSFMKELQDLMVKGYEPKMSFERDFISEGIDLINSYYH